MNKPLTISATVLQAIIDLVGQNRVASRQAIVKETGLGMKSVDEAVRTLLQDELIRRPVNGVFEPVDQRPDRAVSGTILPNGLYKLEIGDICLELTPRETRCIGELTFGKAMLFGR